MPFTFAHPAIVLPLKKILPNYFSHPALVIGAMAPDFEYFLRLTIKSTISHTIPGLFCFNLISGLAVFYWYRFIFESTTLKITPKKTQHISYNASVLNSFFIILFSILVGASSHLLWDSFTHKTGFFVTHFSVFSTSLSFFGINVPVFKILQHSSTAVGSIYIIAYVKSNFTISICKNLSYWLSLIILTFLVLAVVLNSTKTSGSLANYIIQFFSSIFIAITILNPCFKWFRKGNHPTS